ncbi:MAG: OadG family protein [Halioglobus sp.]
MRGDIVDQGIELMLYGMGTVVVFLTLLIATVSLMSWFLSRFFPEAEVPVARASHELTTVSSKSGDLPLVAVIAAAVHRHRSGRQ